MAFRALERRIWVANGVVILGVTMSILDTTIVNVALRRIALDLRTPLPQVQWIITGYLLALGATIPLSGWAARRFGAKPTYQVSLLLFTVGSLACGLSSSISMLVFFRVLQGIGGGMLMPLAMIIMAGLAGPQQMGRVMAVASMPAMLAPIVGPVVGGLIVGNLHWSWIFFVNVPLGAFSLLLGVRLLPHTDAGEAGPLDLRGLVLLPAGVVGLTYGVSEVGAGKGLLDAHVLWPLAGGLLSILAFCLHAPRARRPLLDLRLYRNPVFTGAALTTVATSCALFGAMILVPLYYQLVRHEGVVATGLLTAPQGLGAMVALPLSSRLAETVGAGRVAIAGVVVLALSTFPLALIGAATSFVWISAVLVVRGLSIGLCFMPAISAAFASLSPAEVSDASPQLNVLQRIGGAVGTAAIAAVLAREAAHAHTAASLAHAYDVSYWWALGIAALALPPCLLLLRAQAGAKAPVEVSEALSA